MPVVLEELQTTIPGAENPMQVTCKILIEGEEIPSSIPVNTVTIHRAVNKIPGAVITILDGDVSRQTFEVSNTDLFIPGKQVEIQLGYQTNATKVFRGIITGHANRIRGANTELVITCKDLAVKMTVQKKNAHFNDITDSELATQLISGYGDLRADIESTSVAHQNLVQYNLTDWDFMLQRLDLAGLYCTVEDGTVIARKPDLQQERVFDIVYGATLQDYQAQIDARMQPTAANAFAWDHGNQQLNTAAASEPSLQESGNLPPSDLAAAVGYASMDLRYTGQWTEAELQAVADARLQKQRLAAIRGHVKFQGVATIMPGKFIVVAGVGDRFSGPLYVSAITHEYEDGNWLSEATLGLEPVWYAEQINPYHPTAASGMMPSVQGLHIGVVVDNEDPSGSFRVQVRIPAVNDTEPGVWARVATLDAGDNRGTFFRPEIGDEVIVGFLGDDPRHVVILGMLHSSAKPAPLQPSNDNHEKGYQSREGFKMIFNDQDKSYTLESPGGRKIVIDDTAGIITIDDGTGNKITMDSAGVTVEAVTTLTLKGGASIKLEAPQIEVNGSGQLALKGGMVMIN